MKPIVKHVLAGIAVVTALASVVAGREQPAQPNHSLLVEPVKRVDTRLRTDDIDLSKLESRAGEESKNDAFAPRSFGPPPEREAARQRRAERPETPPLPFRYVGKMQDGDKLSVFIANGEESLVIAPGQRIGEYRVDAITDEEIRFTYLPLKTKQVLPL